MISSGVKVGPWELHEPVPGARRTWRARDDHGQWATVEVFFGSDEAVGSRLRAAYAANSNLAALGAERLIDVATFTPMPETWGLTHDGEEAFWVARDDLLARSPRHPLDAAAAAALCEGLLALVERAASLGVQLDLSPEAVTVLDGGAFRVARPGIASGGRDARLAIRELVLASADSVLTPIIASVGDVQDLPHVLRAGPRREIPSAALTPAVHSALVPADSSSNSRRAVSGRRVGLWIGLLVLGLTSLLPFAVSSVARDWIARESLPPTEKLLVRVPSPLRDTCVPDAASGATVKVNCSPGGGVDLVSYQQFDSIASLQAAYRHLVPDSITGADCDTPPSDTATDRGHLGCLESPVHGLVMVWSDEPLNVLVTAISQSRDMAALEAIKAVAGPTP